MPHPFDATLKDLFAQAPADPREPFRLPEFEPARTLNVDLSTISAATDLAIGFGEPLQEIADLNFQSGPDPKVVPRLLLYNAALHMKFNVPVRSILVLLRAKAATPGLTDKLTYTSGDKRVSFEYDLIRLWEEPVDRFLEGGVGLLPLAPLCKVSGEMTLQQSLRNVIRAIDRRLAAIPDHAKAVRLMTATFILTALRMEGKNCPRFLKECESCTNRPLTNGSMTEKCWHTDTTFWRSVANDWAIPVPGLKKRWLQLTIQTAWNG
jgi:hypothetical protein